MKKEYSTQNIFLLNMGHLYFTHFYLNFRIILPMYIKLPPGILIEIALTL